MLPDHVGRTSRERRPARILGQTWTPGAVYSIVTVRLRLTGGRPDSSTGPGSAASSTGRPRFRSRANVNADDLTMTISQRPSPRLDPAGRRSVRRRRLRSAALLTDPGGRGRLGRGSAAEQPHRRYARARVWRLGLGAVALALAATLGASTPSAGGGSPRAHALAVPASPISASAKSASALPASGESGDWRLPLAGRPEAVRGFDPPDSKWGQGHRGVDLLGTDGEQVRAAGGGEVTYAGLLAGRGVVTVSHGDVRTTYEPLDVSVRVGTTVQAGSVIGTLTAAHSHCAPRVCLHWGLIRGERYLDPLTLVGAGPPRLLPLDQASTTVGGEAAGDEHATFLAPSVRGGDQATGVGPPGSPAKADRARDTATSRAQPDAQQGPDQGRRPESPANAAEPQSVSSALSGAVTTLVAPAAGAVAGALAAGLVLRLSGRSQSPPPTRPPPRTPPAHPAALRSTSGAVVRLDVERRRLRGAA